LLLAAVTASLFSVRTLGQVNAAEVKLDQILPPQTRLFISLVDYPDFKRRFAQTQHGKIWNDPAMREFRDSVLQRPIRVGGSAGDPAAISLAELDRVASGVVSYAVLETAAGRPTEVLFVGVAGKRDEAESLIREVTTRAAEKGATVANEPYNATTLQLVGTSQGPGEDQPLVMFLREDWLVMVRGRDPATAILDRWSGEAAQTLAGDAVYGRVMQTCRAQRKNREAEIYWFIDPFNYAELYFVFDPESDDIGPAAFAQKHGFDSVRGLAGCVHVSDQGYDLQVHLAIDLLKPAREAMQMLEFPGTRDLAPPKWVAADISAYTAMSWTLIRIIEHGGPLFDDEFLGGIEGTFQDILDDTRRESRIDLGGDLFARLGPTVTQISEPATSSDQDNLIAVEVRESEVVADILKRLLRPDPEIRRLRAEGLPNDVWQIPNADLTTLNLTVTPEHLLISTSPQLMSEFVRPLSDAEQLAAAADWQRVEKAWQPFIDEQTFLGAFSRPAVDILAAYDYLRGGAVGTSDSIYVQLISKLTDVRGKSAPEFSKLPPFEQIKHYLGPVGIVATTTDEGWLATGFALPAAQ
jgi:hypothetical protein